LNHYSILGEQQLAALLSRCGFNIDFFNNLEFDVQTPNETRELVTSKEKYYCVLATKARPLDIK
jgi:hypothetical protein